jgi:asparagine synthase (glutamine-hydrolysing)
MCGICGILLKRPLPSSSDATELCHGMGKLLSHRGPDATGFWSDHNRGVFFEQRRLAIIDLSPSGEQPFFNEDKSLVCMVNGEIYNFQDLRSELKNKGHQFRSQCDVETVVHLFEEQGIEGWAKLRGMFAISLYDTKTDSLYLSRDPLGIKPLYIYEDEDVLAFSSEIRAFSILPTFDRQLDWNGLFEFLLLGSIAAPHSYLKKVRALEPGEVVKISAKQIVSSSGGSPIPKWCNEQRASVDIGSVKECLRDSVKKHLVSDVPIGVFLSGGIDSGTLAGIASEISSTPIHTVSVTIPGNELDESSFAQETSKLFGTKHQEIPIDQKSFEKDFESFFQHLDQPSIDGFNTYIVSKAAREAGLTVALSGVGGDELFGGYNSFRIIPKMMRMHWLMNLGGSLGRKSGAAVLETIRSGSASARVSEHFRSQQMDIRHAYMACRGLFAGRFLEKLILPEYRSHMDSAKSRFFESTKWARNKNIPVPVAIAGLELTRYMTTQLLRDTDVMSMAHSLEVRTPLVDVDVIHTCLPFLAETNLATDNDPKWLLRQSLDRRLPDRVVRRPKQGFVFPWQKWLQGSVSRDFERILSETGTWDQVLQREAVEWWRDAYKCGWSHWSCFWALYVLLRFIESRRR